MTGVLDMVKAVLATTAQRWLDLTKTPPLALLFPGSRGGQQIVAYCSFPVMCACPKIQNVQGELLALFPLEENYDPR